MSKKQKYHKIVFFFINKLSTQNTQIICLVWYLSTEKRKRLLKGYFLLWKVIL